MVKVSDVVGLPGEDFSDFDLTEIQIVLNNLQAIDAIDLAHAELLSQQSLRCADILSEYIARMVKTVSYLEGKINSTKNKISLEYIAPDGVRTTVEMKKWAGESSPKVDELQEKLASAKGTKSLLEKKYDIVIKSHHHYKDIAAGLRRTILGYKPGATEATAPEGYE